MGGKALGYEARRITPDELFQINQHVCSTYSDFTPKLIPSYRSKQDHGDVDFVLVGNYGGVRDAVMSRSQPASTYDNKPTLSWDHDGVQIDFTVCSTSTMQQAQVDYMAWNDLGNFIGRVARSIDFKYGHEGLKYVVRLSDHTVTELDVSHDIGLVLEFLGYNSAVWRMGFDTKEEIFAYASSTPLFNPLYFSLEEQAHQDRVRNAKRAMYRDMLEYIQQHGMKPRPKLTPGERHQHLVRAETFFGVDIQGQIDALRESYALHERRKQKLNGQLVREWTGLEGRMLGATLTQYKQELLETFPTALDDWSTDAVRQHFMKWFNQCNG